jgi:hypothetical protein
MLSAADKQAIPILAGGVLNQDGTSNVLGLVAKHVTTGIWTFDLPEVIMQPNYIFVFGNLSAFSPGVTASMADSTPTQKLVQIFNTNTGANIDVAISFMIYELLKTLP